MVTRQSKLNVSTFLQRFVRCGLLVTFSGAFAIIGDASAWGDGEARKGASSGSAAPVSAGDSEMAISELRLALQASELRCKELEELLGRQQEGDVPLESALAVANAEAAAYRERYRDLRLNVESWGMETLGSDKALRERLIVAVREREQSMKRHAQALQQLLALSEAMVDYLKTPDAKSRVRVEAQLRKTDEVLGFGSKRVAAEKDAKSMDEGRVVSLKEDYRLAVVDVGKRSGIRLGMPMDFYRKDRMIGSGVVVDVRDQISGLIVQKIYKEGDQVKVSDRAEPHASTTIEF